MERRAERASSNARGLGQLAGGPVVLRGQRVRLPMVQKGNASHTRDGLNGKATWGDGERG